VNLTSASGSGSGVDARLGTSSLAGGIGLGGAGHRCEGSPPRE